MPTTEFELITHYFSQSFPERPEIVLGIGDDAALCTVSPTMQLAISVDTLVAGVHFPLTTSPYDIGYKSLAVNLSDMAAMAATPAWFTLALTCPHINETWLQGFTEGLLELATATQVCLIGGDTTRGPLTITIQIIGLVPAGQALLRRGATVGDGIYVTGTLGEAGLALQWKTHQLYLAPELQESVELRLNRPTPRLQEGLALRGIASSAIDISDGLLADLGHILTASGVGATLQLADLPLSPLMRKHLSLQTTWQLALSAGDDYELCFTVPPHQEKRLATVLPPHSYTRIGKIERALGLRCIDHEGQLFVPPQKGYDHFSRAKSK